MIWARVEFNGRSLGWYVLKEGFTQDFAERSGLGAGIVLAEPQSGSDLGGVLDLKEGTASMDAALASWRVPAAVPRRDLLPAGLVLAGLIVAGMVPAAARWFEWVAEGLR